MNYKLFEILVYFLYPLPILSYKISLIIFRMALVCNWGDTGPVCSCVKCPPGNRVYYVKWIITSGLTVYIESWVRVYWTSFCCTVWDRLKNTKEREMFDRGEVCVYLILFNSLLFVHGFTVWLGVFNSTSSFYLFLEDMKKMKIFYLFIITTVNKFLNLFLISSEISSGIKFN